MKYTSKLSSAISKNKSRLVIGLDSDLNKIPDFFHKFKNPVSEFNRQIISITKDTVAGYKLNMAFYECLEEKGIGAIRESMKMIPDDLISICDAKRCDIGNSAEYYAITYLEKYHFDSITLSPYMGEDSIAPFIKDESKGVYLLALTSNPGAADFQFMKCGYDFLYQSIVDRCLLLNRNKNIGFVFGANHDKELNKFTSGNPDIPLLIPGVGAQGNEIERLMTNLKSELFLINSSRGIIYSAPKNSSHSEFENAVNQSTIELSDKINSLQN